MLAIKLLGQFDIRLDGQPVALPSRPAQTLLAYLLLFPAAHRRERLAGLLWPEATEANARAYLRQALWRLRRALASAGRDTFLADDLTLQFHPRAEIRLDVADLERDDASLDALRASVRAYEGELLPGFYPDWVAAERERLRSVFEAKMARLLDGLAAERRWPEVVEWAERWLTHSAVAEPAYRGLLRAHGEQGQRAGVAAAYRRCLMALQAELGVEPSEQTRTVYAAALQAAGAAPDTPPPSPSAERPEAGARPFNNLPAPTTPFVGRGQELAEIAARLGQADCRLLTLVGPGGIGKTRLALEAAMAQAEAGTFADGVGFVPLALIASAEYLGGALADALALSLYGGQLAEAQLLGYMRPRQMLLVVDMFEHVLDGANLLNTLLAGAPGLKLLVTSQERLNLRGEWLLEIEGMSVPPEASEALDLSAYSAVQLFTQSARRVEASFTLNAGNQAAVARLCQLVGGMPLGLELAAAWLRALPVEAIAEAIAHEAGFLSTSLRDVPARHRSLQAVFDHSWRRLPPDEQAVYRRLAVLRGSFGREAAERVAGASLAHLAALVDKSLLHRTTLGRYEMHGLLQRYALAQLAEAEERAATLQRHLDYCVALVERAEPGLRQGDQLDWLRRLEDEHDNLRAALEWSVSAGEPAAALAGLRLAGAIGRFWYLRGYWQEGRHWLRKLLGRVAESPRQMGAEEGGAPDVGRKTKDEGRRSVGQTGAVPDAQRGVSLARAKALAALGWLANEDAAEEAAYAESLRLYRAAGEAWGTAYALRGLGARAWNVGEPERSGALLEESLGLFEAAGDAWGQGLVRLNQGWLAHDADDVARAGALWREGLRLFEQTGDRWGQAVALSDLGYLARLQHDDAAARETSASALGLFEALGDKAGTATTLVRLGQVALRRANFAQARELFEKTLTLQRALEFRWEAVASLGELGLIAAIQGDYDRAQGLFEEGLGLAQTVTFYTPLWDLYYNQGQAAYYAGDLGRAEAAWQTSARQYQEQEDPVGAALAQAGLALVAWRRGAASEAPQTLREALAAVLAGGDRRDIAHVALALGRVTLAQGGDEDAASALLEEGRQLYHKLGDKHGEAQALEAQARLHAAWHAPNGAARLLGTAQALREAVGAPLPAIDAEDYEALLTTLREEVGEAGLREALRAGARDRAAPPGAGAREA